MDFLIGKYGIIYADPPWKYRVWAERASRTADSHYPVMDNADIGALPVANIAADDCALFLWATPPCLEEALEVMGA